MYPTHPLPASPKLPRLRSPFWKESSEPYSYNGNWDRDHDMQEYSEAFKARPEDLDRGLRSSPQAPKPSLPSFKDVLRSLDLPGTAAETRKAEKWKHIIQPTPAQRTLSIFNCPDATYMWPSSQFASQDDKEAAPILYVDYPHSRHDRYVDNRLREDSSRALRREPKQRYPRNSYSDGDFHMRHAPTYSPRSHHLTTSISSPAMRENRGHSQLSDFREASLPDRSPSPSDSYASSFSTDNFDSRNASELSVSEGSQHWEEYTKTSTTSDGKIEYECLWPHPNDPTKICGFKRKKQGVKRHVEAKHLGIRRHVCSYCGQAFSTKLTVDCHTWRKHTGEKPLPCRYGCGKSFNDPARQFRHYESAHGYVSVHPRKKTKVDIS